MSRRQQGTAGTSKFARTTAFLVAACICWALSVALLWWAYGFTQQVATGRYTRIQSLSLIIKMGLLVTALTCIIWILASWRWKAASIWKLGWAVAGGTGLILCFYLALVVIRRQLWNAAQGINDDAMFWPLVGHLNAAFMSGYDWLIFLLWVIPCMSVVSPTLFCIQERIGREAARSQT
jgi:hypothetical protein